MRLSRVSIRNFRNFKNLDVRLGKHAVFLGENKIGKTNLLFALRLILDPSLPDSARRLRLDDFWDGLPRPLTTDDVIEISAEFRGFEKSENLLAVLADHLVKPDPMVARITYRYQPVAGLGREPKSESDYEFVIFGGGRVQFVFILENILAAVFVSELFPDESYEIAEVLALGLHGSSGSAGEFQVGDVGVNFVLNDIRPAELNDAGSFRYRRNRTLAREPLVFNLVEPQLTPTLRL